MKTQNVGFSPSSYSEEIPVDFVQNSPEDTGERIAHMLSDISDLLKEKGCLMIGHIKALLDTGEHGCVFFSKTSFSGEVRCKGVVKKEAKQGRLIVNIVVFGIDSEAIRKIFRQAVKLFFVS